MNGPTPDDGAPNRTPSHPSARVYQEVDSSWFYRIERETQVGPFATLSEAWAAARDVLIARAAADARNGL